MAKQKQDDQLEHTYSSYVRTRDVTLKAMNNREKWREKVRDMMMMMMMMMILLLARNRLGVTFSLCVGVDMYIYIYLYTPTPTSFESGVFLHSSRLVALP